MEKDCVKKYIKSPEEVLTLLKNYFNKERISIFVITIIIGILVHFLLLSNMIFSQDGLQNSMHYTSSGYEASLGRWGINFFDSLRNDIAIPFLTTIISIFLMGIINNLLIDIFEFKSKIFKFITLLAVVVSPSLCMTLLYVYTADVYFYSMFFAVLTVYAFYKMKNKKVGLVIGILSFIVTLATYQSYMGITVGLIVILAIKKLLAEKDSCFEVIKDLIIKAFILIVSAILYFFITKIIIELMHLTMTTYGGMNEITIFSILKEIISSVKTAYLGFIKYFFADGIILNRIWKREKLYFIFFIITGISLLMLFINTFKKEKSKEYIFRFILAVILIILLPVALNLVIIIAPGNEIYYLTATQMLLIIPFSLMIFELIKEENIIKTILNWGLVITLFIILATYFLSIAVTYQTAELTYNQAKATSIRILDRMEEYPGYRAGMHVLFAGVLDDGNFPKTLDIYNYAITNLLRGSAFHGTYWGQAGTWGKFFNIFFGINLNFCEDYEYYTIINSEEFKQMNIFPGENSVRMINDVMVVKLTETPVIPPLSPNLLEHNISY